MAALLSRLRPGDTVLGGRFTVKKVAPGEPPLVRLTQDDLVLREIPVPDWKAEQACRQLESRARLSHPSLLPVVDFAYEHGVLRLIEPYRAGPTLAELAAKPATSGALELWCEIARQLAALMAYLARQSDGPPPVDFSVDDLKMVDRQLLLVGQAGLASSDGGGERCGAEAHYLRLFNGLMQTVLDSLEAAGCPTTRLMWLLRRRYGSLQELLEALDQELKEAGKGEPIEVTPLDVFEVPEPATEPGLLVLFLRQPLWARALQLSLVGLLGLGLWLWAFSPPAVLPAARLLLRTRAALLVYDIANDHVAARWKIPDSVAEFAAGAGPTGVASLKESSLLEARDLATGEVLDSLLLPTRQAPTQLIANGDEFLALAPGTAVLGDVFPNLKARLAFPVGQEPTRVLLAHGAIYLADGLFLRRYDGRTGAQTEVTRLPGIVELAGVADGRIAALVPTRGVLSLLDGTTLKVLTEWETGADDPKHLVHLGGSTLGFTAGLHWLVLSCQTGDREPPRPLPAAAAELVLSEGRLWLLSLEGELFSTSPAELAWRAHGRLGREPLTRVVSATGQMSR